MRAIQTLKTVAFFLLTMLYLESIGQGIPYQAVILNGEGAILSNQSIPTRFSLHSTSPTGTIEYQETQNLTSNSLGLITTSFGLGQAVIGNFNTIPWGIGAKFIQVEINLNGWQTIGTQQLSAVPYAIRAKQVDADGLKLQSPSGNCFILQVDNNGNISTLAVPCQN